MIPVASRRCLLCSGPLSLPSATGPASCLRGRSTVPVPATAEPRTSSYNEQPLIDPLTEATQCPYSVKTMAHEKTSLKPYEEVPGPRGLPFIGSLLDYMGNGPYDLKKLHLAMMDRFREFGPIFKETMAGTTYVHVIEPEDVKEVIQNEGPTPRRIVLDPLVVYRKQRKRSIGLSNLQGEEWRRLRQPFNQLLFKPSTINSYLPKTDRCAEDFVSLIRKLKTPDGDVPEFTNQLQRWSLETVGNIMLDSRMGCLDGHPNPSAERVIQSVLDFNNTLGELMYSLPFYKLGIYNESWRKFVAAQDFFFESMLSYVDATIDRMSSDERDFSRSVSRPRIRDATFIERLLAMYPNSGPEAISDLLNDLLLSGIDLTASSFTFLIYNLSRNPECQEKLYEEVSRVIPPGEPITPEKLQMMPYLKACVKESTRLHPPVDGTSRILNKDVALSGYNIPANTIIRLHAVAGLMPEYVEEPEKYLPERWLRGADRSIVANPFLTLAFGVGFRGCLGKRLADQQTYVGLIKLIQNFRLEWHHEEVSVDMFLTSRPSRPVQPTVIDRK